MISRHVASYPRGNGSRPHITVKTPISLSCCIHVSRSLISVHFTANLPPPKAVGTILRYARSLSRIPKPSSLLHPPSQL
jgi:hypothetical protein